MNSLKNNVNFFKIWFCIKVKSLIIKKLFKFSFKETSVKLGKTTPEYIYNLKNPCQCQLQYDCKTCLN